MPVESILIVTPFFNFKFGSSPEDSEFQSAKRQFIEHCMWQALVNSKINHQMLKLKFQRCSRSFLLGNSARHGCLWKLNLVSPACNKIQPQTLVYAPIKSVKLTNPTTNGIKYYEDFSSMEFVDLNQVKCVIGQIMDCKRWAIVDHSTSSLCMHV